jgi:hypothetical protein
VNEVNHSISENGTSCASQNPLLYAVIPAKAGIQSLQKKTARRIVHQFKAPAARLNVAQGKNERRSFAALGGVRLRTRAPEGRHKKIVENVREIIQETNSRKINSSLRGASFVLREQNNRRRSNPCFLTIKI